MKQFVKEFKEFIATGNLVEVAVAFVMGLAIKAVIDAFMAGVVNPVIGAIVGKPNLDNVLTFTVREGTANESVISFGLVLTQILSLVIVGLVLFLMLRAYNNFRRKEEAAPTGPTEIELLVQIRDELRSR